MKHAASTIWHAVEYKKPKHSTGWTPASAAFDTHFADGPYNPARHAKPFAAHHPARPVTYNATGTTTPLNPPTNVLDAVA